MKVSPIDGEADSSEGPEEIFIIHKAVSTAEQMDGRIKRVFSVKKSQWLPTVNDRKHATL